MFVQRQSLILHAVVKCCGAATATPVRRLAWNVRRTKLHIMLPKRAEAATTTPRERREAFRLLVEGVRVYAILMLDGAGVVSNRKTGAERLDGYVAEEIVELHF